MEAKSTYKQVDMDWQR